jgi:RNA polymerase sigma-70 factor (ECF subfamily)
MNPSNEGPVSSLRTRPSLLLRVRSWDDRSSWNEFHRLYRKLVYGLARRSGLAHDDAEDVAQEVFKRVAETIDQFESDPSRGSFRGWLMNLTRWRIANKFARRPKEGIAPAPGPDGDGPAAVQPVDLLPDGGDADAQWEEEWRQHVLNAAFERLARTANSRHFQAFDLHVRQHWSVSEVARELDMNPASVYVVCHRLTKLLKAEVAALRETLG